MIFKDTVSRDLYDAAIQRAERAERLYDELMERFHSLRMQGQAPVKPAVLIPPKPDSGQLAVMGAERALRTPGAQKLIEELMQKGKSEAEACRIVAEMQNVAKGKALPEPLAP